MTELRLIAIDVGTTHLKAGLLALDGTILAQLAVPTPLRKAAEGYEHFDHELIWSSADRMIGELCAHPSAGKIASIGIAGMAESGLLVDRRSGAARSRMIPWHDMSAAAQAERISLSGSVEERFYASGIRPSFKCSLMKILWLRDQQGVETSGSVWLCAPDYLAYRFTGCMATDYSLASRTYAFQIYEQQWDQHWLRQFDLNAENWPSALPWGTPVGKTTVGLTKIPQGIPVFITGHDHVCASLVLPADQPATVLDSIGTAESLLGVFPRKRPGKAEFESGLAFGSRGEEDQFYWLGGLSSSGGAIEWLRHLSGIELTYEKLSVMAESLDPGPGNVLFYPYLSGSGSPHSEPGVRGALIGLGTTHRLPDLLKAVLEGTAYEIEFMRQRAQGLLGLPITRITATGGGTRLPRWMQIRADVTGCCYEMAQTSEAVLLGAAMISAVGAGIYSNVSQAQAAMLKTATQAYTPEFHRHARYQQIFENGFMTLQEPLRQLYRSGY